MDKILECDDFTCYRFACDCLHHKHLMEITFGLYENVLCEIHIYVGGSSPLRWRLKQIWNLLRGREGELVDFIVRPEDLGELAVLFNKHRQKRSYKRRVK